MNTEYGIFNDEGCIEAGFYSEKSAQVELAKYYIDGERGLTISEICSEHEEQAKHACEECFDEECQHDNVRQISEDEVECIDCGLVSA